MATPCGKESCFICEKLIDCPNFTSEFLTITPDALARKLAERNPRQPIGRAAMLPETKNGKSRLTRGAESASKTT